MVLSFFVGSGLMVRHLFELCSLNENADSVLPLEGVYDISRELWILHCRRFPVVPKEKPNNLSAS